MSKLQQEVALTYTDIAIISTEWQGEKMVYVFEVKIPNMKPHRVFRRFKNMEECYKRVAEKYPNLKIPEVCKKKFMNQKTELVERRLIAFELFFQFIVMHPETKKDITNVMEFLRL